MLRLVPLPFLLIPHLFTLLLWMEKKGTVTLGHFGRGRRVPPHRWKMLLCCAVCVNDLSSLPHRCKLPKEGERSEEEEKLL